MSASPYLFDSNIWIAFAFDEHSHHHAARSAFARVTSRRPACFCRATELSFLRLASTPTILAAYGASSLTNADVLDVYRQLRTIPVIDFHEEPEMLETLWPAMGTRTNVSPKVWMDAYLAAFAIAGDYTFVTLDAAFKEYEKNGLNLSIVTI